MDINALNTSMSEEQARYAIWVEENTPFLLPLFDFGKREYLPGRVDQFFAVASPSEAMMARFVLGVWLHEDKYDFDFVDAAVVLDENQMRVITDWLKDPFWP